MTRGQSKTICQFSWLCPMEFGLVPEAQSVRTTDERSTKVLEYLEEIGNGTLFAQ